MMKAIALAKKAGQNGDVPVAAIIINTLTGHIISQSDNQMRRTKKACAHAELLAINAACEILGQERLDGHTLIVTLEPCAMCAGAIAHARLDKVIFGAYDPKGGAVEHGPQLFQQHTIHHQPEIIGGVEEAQCAALLKDFFDKKRIKNA